MTMVCFNPFTAFSQVVWKGIHGYCRIKYEDERRAQRTRMAEIRLGVEGHLQSWQKEQSTPSFMADFNTYAPIVKRIVPRRRFGRDPTDLDLRVRFAIGDNNLRPTNVLANSQGAASTVRALDSAGGADPEPMEIDEVWESDDVIRPSAPNPLDRPIWPPILHKHEVHAAKRRRLGLEGSEYAMFDGKGRSLGVRSINAPLANRWRLDAKRRRLNGWSGDYAMIGTDGKEFYVRSIYTPIVSLPEAFAPKVEAPTPRSDTGVDSLIPAGNTGDRGRGAVVASESPAANSEEVSREASDESVVSDDSEVEDGSSVEPGVSEEDDSDSCQLEPPPQPLRRSARLAARRTPRRSARLAAKPRVCYKGMC